VLDLVTPSRQAGRQHQADGAGTNNDCSLLSVPWAAIEANYAGLPMS
jgi:hypothetical protein